MSEAALLPIGALADATGVSVSTLRYYDDIGLITTAHRVGGKRRFSGDTPGRVNFVRRAQLAGFSLEQIRGLLDDETEGWTDVVADQLDVLRAKRDELDVMIGILEEAQSCGCSTVVTCPRLSATC